MTNLKNKYKSDGQKELFNEVLGYILDRLGEFQGDYVCDLHNDLFNTGYWEVHECGAKQALNRFDVFDAISIIKEYEEENFGGFITEIDPIMILNTLTYVIGEEILQTSITYYANYDGVLTKALIKGIADELEIC